MDVILGFGLCGFFRQKTISDMCSTDPESARPSKAVETMERPQVDAAAADDRRGESAVA